MNFSAWRNQFHLTFPRQDTAELERLLALHAEHVASGRATDREQREDVLIHALNYASAWGVKQLIDRGFVPEPRVVNYFFYLALLEDQSPEALLDMWGAMLPSLLCQGIVARARALARFISLASGDEHRYPQLTWQALRMSQVGKGCWDQLAVGEVPTFLSDSAFGSFSDGVPIPASSFPPPTTPFQQAWLNINPGLVLRALEEGADPDLVCPASYLPKWSLRTLLVQVDALLDQGWTVADFRSQGCPLLGEASLAQKPVWMGALVDTVNNPSAWQGVRSWLRYHQLDEAMPASVSVASPRIRF